MKQPAKFAKAVVGAIRRNSGEMLHERIPLRDMSDCLLAVYDEISRRAFQRCLVRGAQEGTDREDWRAAEDDLFARVSVDFEESSGNLYALVSLPECASAEITVAVDECWLLIAGYVNQGARKGVEDDFGDYAVEDIGDDSGCGQSSQGLIHSRESRDDDRRCESRETPSDERSAERQAPICGRRGHSAWWRCGQRWIRDGASRCFRTDCWRYAWGRPNWKRRYRAWRETYFLCPASTSTMPAKKPSLPQVQRQRQKRSQTLPGSMNLNRPLHGQSQFRPPQWHKEAALTYDHALRNLRLNRAAAQCVHADAVNKLCR